MTRDDFRRRASELREIPLEVVLSTWGATRDLRDRQQWRTEHGPLTVTGPRFFNWHAHQGGGGAIDLVMHLGGWDAREAMKWLACHLSDSMDQRSVVTNDTVSTSVSKSVSTSKANPFAPCCNTERRVGRPLQLPAFSVVQQDRVVRYLTQQRGLSPRLVTSLMETGSLYADQRGNAVFLMVAGKPARPIGAELRGTGPQPWRGLAPGTRRDAGYFWIGSHDARRIILCESAIDAISCYQLHSDPSTRRDPHDTSITVESICISTAGVRPDAPWLKPLFGRGYDIHCGFDNDEPGETSATRMMQRHPSIQRLRPSAHDWNDALTASR